jgi:hypothetical protein
VSGADHRTVGELRSDSDELARETLLDATPDHASAMVRSFRASINLPWLIPGTCTCGGRTIRAGPTSPPHARTLSTSSTSSDSQLCRDHW